MSKPFQLPMLFSEAPPVRDLVSQDTGADSAMTAISGLKWLDWFASQDLDVSLLRMFVEVFPAGLSMQYVTTWNLKATPAGRSYFQLAYSAHPMSATDSSLWPTPAATDTRARQPAKHIHRTRNGTLRAINRQGGQTQMRLSQVVLLWSTPAAQDRKNASLPASQATRDTLPGDLLRNGYSGYLNPDWVEQLMGLPVGWTDLTQPTASSASLPGKGRISTPSSRPERSAKKRRITLKGLKRSVTRLSGSRHFPSCRPLSSGYR